MFLHPTELDPSLTPLLRRNLSEVLSAQGHPLSETELDAACAQLLGRLPFRPPEAALKAALLSRPTAPQALEALRVLRRMHVSQDDQAQHPAEAGLLGFEGLMEVPSLRDGGVWFYPGRDGQSLLLAHNASPSLWALHAVHWPVPRQALPFRFSGFGRECTPKELRPIAALLRAHAPASFDLFETDVALANYLTFLPIMAWENGPACRYLVPMEGGLSEFLLLVQTAGGWSVLAPDRVERRSN